MAKRQVLTFTDPVLRERSEEVVEFSAEISELVRDMIDTMYTDEGVGLAAPQVGVLKRVIVFDVSEERNDPMHLINPEIIVKEGVMRSEEGCLCIPGFKETINRCKSVTVRGFDKNGNPLEFQAEALLSRVLQHEIDHLNGILFIDHLSRQKKEIFNRWLKKQAESRAV